MGCQNVHPVSLYGLGHLYHPLSAYSRSNGNLNLPTHLQASHPSSSFLPTPLYVTLKIFRGLFKNLTYSYVRMYVSTKHYSQNDTVGGQKRLT